MTTPTKEMQDPNRGPVSALKRRPPVGGELGLSPSKQQRKEKRMDRRTRRVSFAPDPELTMVHHFEKDEFSANSEGRQVLSRLEEQEDTQQTDAGYQPGFLGKTVPDHSPLHGSLPLDSPGMVSMEITQPVLEVRQGFAAGYEDHLQQQQHLDVSMDITQPVMEGQQGYAAGHEDQLQQGLGQPGWGRAFPGEVTAGLPSLGALAEADEAYEEQMLQQGKAGWDGAEVTLNITHNITGGIPGLSSLIAEDEEADAAQEAASPEDATAGMDLTVAAGRVLEHSAQPEAEEQAEQPAAELAQPGRRSSTNDLVQQREVQVNKWGFAPGGEDTLDINLEMHGRMIMGDTTFSRMYGDNTTGDTHGRPIAVPAESDAAQPVEVEMAQDSPQAPRRQAEPDAEQQADELFMSPETAPQHATREQAQQQRQPNWQAPAFMPPYMQKARSFSSDHPALVQSPADTNSTMNTMETRRLSAGDTRRLSDVRSRRMSLQDETGRLLQDETGRLLQDDSEDDMGLDLQPGSQPTGRQQDGAVGAGRSVAGHDITENLLADDEAEDGMAQEEDGPLAELKRGLRMLSQQEAQQEQPAEEPLAEKAARTPPRPAHSVGVADSSNPVTMALLRSGGTTRLLQDTMHVQPMKRSQPEVTTMPAGAGGGTTKLLADMTMVSMVGAKRQHAGPSSHHRLSQDADAGLTDYSLDGFDTPPELPMSQQQREQQQQAQGSVPANQMQHSERGQNDGPEAARQQQQHEATPSPAPTSQGAGYPLNLHGQYNSARKVPTIPGGPKLARTPVSSRPVASQRTNGTPHSVRSMPQQPTPASRLQDTTPTSAARPSTSAATYPVPHDTTTDQIPGGPKLARTPIGGRSQHVHALHEHVAGGAKTPLTGRLPSFPAAPGSAMAQHYPGAAGQAPTSAMLLRYPGSAVAAHRLGSRGMTPLQPQQPALMTFQDFAKLMDVQFLDNLRRGTSINYADMQPNPVPKNPQEAYNLLCAISPQVAVLERGITILQSLVQNRRTNAAELEAAIGLQNPSLFRDVQYVDEEQLEAMKSNVGLLKKLLRQRAVAELKAYRKEMEEDKAQRLMRNLERLQHDRMLLEDNEKTMIELAKAAQQYIADELRRMDGEVQAQQAESERRQRIMAMRASLQEQQEGNALRQQQLAEVQGRVASLKATNSNLGRQREVVQSQIEALEQRLFQTHDAAALAHQSSPQALLEKSECLEVLTAATGWGLEQLQQGSDSATLVLRVADLFRMQLRIGNGVATGSVQLAPGAGANPHLSEDRRELIADLLAGSGMGHIHIGLAGAGTTNLMAELQAASARLASLAELVKELDGGLRLSCTSLSEVSCTQGTVCLGFVNLNTETQFSVTLCVPTSYPVGDMPHKLKIRSDGGGHITAEAVGAAIAAVPQERGRIRAVCAALANLASSTAPAKPFFLQPPSPACPETASGVLLDANFQNYSNPLFGAATASCSTHS